MKKTIYRVSNIPVFQNKIYNTKEEAINCLKGNVELVGNQKTGLIHNCLFDPRKMIYDINYQNEQGNSLFFKKYLNDLVEFFDTFKIKEEKIVEIGCGKGLFLEMMRNRGFNVIGYDPTYEGEKEYIIKEYFTQNSALSGAGFIYLRHTLEHIQNPFEFIREIHHANHGQGRIFIEVPTFDWITENRTFYDIFYEHVNYFTEDFLSSMFTSAETGRLFNGQYIYVLADLSNLKSEINFKEDNKANIQLNFENEIEHWQSKILEFEKVYVWGAGAKGSTFLNHLDKSGELVEAVVDINPKKQHHYIGGTGHYIITPEEIKHGSNTLLLVMNENYLDEIKNDIGNQESTILTA